ncbi:hypothetical protein J2Z62_000533 [Mycoplasmoides fastidiosum]|uniref:Uncharacterized protein n=1 Tax=Mycoplasmoides fastidiosum TaxID=92758 RepID=A0ABU0LZT2_9BACT|nr:hypothetical protein [Mycoplasmoides fastidiosum]MDQ0514095.1 hypothetical protein [Mycoplasmoides fastidiosum]UUD37496.1 hypothetical protein NPA10_02915 [Mycoplasmoides fastidiosum]
MKKIAKRLFGSALFWFVGLSTGVGLTAQNQKINTPKNLLSNLVIQKFQYQQKTEMTDAKNLTDEEIEVLITNALQQVHAVFERKFEQINRTYPNTESGQTSKAITYLLSRITDANNGETADYYNQLVTNLKILIDRNFNARIFASKQDKSKEDGIPFPSYRVQLNDNNSKSIRGDDYQRNQYLEDNLINTAGASQIRSSTNSLLKNLVSFLTTDKDYGSYYDSDDNFPLKTYQLNNDQFGMGWYNKIPDNLKPRYVYNTSFDKTSYVNLITALTTTKNNSTIITDATNLQNLTSVFNNALDSQQTRDYAYLNEINSDTNSVFTKLFKDDSVNNLNALIEQVDSLYKITNAENFWNFNFSNAQFISVNNHDYPGIELVSKKINYSTSSSDMPSFEYGLKFNNAFASFRTSDFPYRGDFTESGNQILKTAVQLVNQKFSQFFELDKSANLKSFDLTLNPNDLKKTDIVQQLEQSLPFSFQIQNVQRQNPTYFGNLQPKEFLFRVDYSINLGSGAPFNWYSHFNETYHAFLKVPNYAALEKLKEAPELPPILDFDNLSKMNLGSFNDVLKDPEFLTNNFNYQNFDAAFAYHAIKAEPNKDKLIITTEVVLNGSELSKTYESELPISGLLDSEQFNNALQLIRDHIEQQLKDKYPEQYEYYMREENKWLRDELLSKALEQTKSDPSFLTNTLEENINLFSQKFLEGFLDFFSQSDQDALHSKIHEHYQNIREKLIAVLHRLGISLDSDLAKILLNQINFEEHKSLEEGKIIPPSAELAAILDFLNDPDTNIDKLKEIAPILEKLNPYLLAKTFNTTQRVSLYTVSTLTFMMSLISSGFIWRVSRIDGQKFKLRKGIFLAIGISILLLSLGGSGFLISLLAAS